LDYITVKNSEYGNEIKYRVCARRVHYNESSRKIDWVDSTIVVVINDKVLIQTLITRDGKGNYKYVDRYDYDELGRKTKMSHSVFSSTGTTVSKEEFTYEDENNIGVSSQSYYFRIPFVFYNLSDYISWCTVAEETIQLE